MIPFFPKQIATKAIYLYLGSLAFVSLFFLSHAMQPIYLVMGVVWVTGFFLLTSYCSRVWEELPRKQLLWYLFLIALGLRLIWVTISYFFYIDKTGMPFEFETADSLGYWEDASWLSTQKWSVVRDYLFNSTKSISDSGYLLYLTYLYKLITPNIFVTRIIKAFISSATVLLIYFLAQRNIGEKGGRIAAIFACFMPNFIIYCGLHLKETEMIFLMVAYLERADYLLRSRHYNVVTITVPILLALSLFTLRTVLGASALFAFVTAVLFNRNETIGRAKRVILIAWIALAVATLAGGAILNEAEGMWQDRARHQDAKREMQTERGVAWAQYATGTVMAPMMFVLPFSTMVDVDQQYNQQIISGGNYVRNFLGIFVLIALVYAVFIVKNWRDLTLLWSFVFAYLGIISVSGFSNSERFLLPGLPVLLIFASYGIVLLNEKNYRFVKIWYYVVPVMLFGWAFYKLGSRGIL